MAYRQREQSNRSFGEGLSKAADFVQRGVGTAVALKGLWDTGQQVYTLARAAAPVVSALLYEKNLTYRHASNAFSQVRGFAQQVDRGIGKAARIYSQLAPIVAPLAREALGGSAAEAVRKHIQTAVSSYGNARAKVQRADAMGRTLHRMNKQETVGI